MKLKNTTKNFYTVSMNLNSIGITIVDNDDDPGFTAIEILMRALHTMGFGSVQDYFNCLPGFSEKDELKFYNDDTSNFKLYFDDDTRRNFFHILFIRRGYMEELMDIKLLLRTTTDGTDGLMFNIQPTLEDCCMCCGNKIEWNEDTQRRFFFCSDWDFEESAIKNGITD